MFLLLFNTHQSTLTYLLKIESNFSATLRKVAAEIIIIIGISTSSLLTSQNGLRNVLTRLAIDSINS